MRITYPTQIVSFIHVSVGCVELTSWLQDSDSVEELPRVPQLSAQDVVETLTKWDGMEDSTNLFRNILHTEQSLFFCTAFQCQCVSGCVVVCVLQALLSGPPARHGPVRGSMLFVFMFLLIGVSDVL